MAASCIQTGEQEGRFAQAKPPPTLNYNLTKIKKVSYVHVEVPKMIFAAAFYNLIVRVFTSATRDTTKTLTQAGHLEPKFWVPDIRT